MSSTLISTLAIVRANYDARRDYLSNFEPFVVDGLKRWNGQPVAPLALRDVLCREFSLPEMPINTAKQLIERVKSDGYLRLGSDGQLYPEPLKLDSVAPLAESREAVLRHIQHLIERLVAYARDNHGLDWAEGDAERALEKFIEEFSVEMATAKRTGAIADRATADTALVVVHAFARRSLERDHTSLDYLEEMVRASMLTNALYFHDVGSWSPSMPQLTVYFDTPVVLRMIGWAPGPMVAAASEMLALVRAFKITPKVYQHTIAEMQGILEAARIGLRYALTTRPGDRGGVPRASGEVVQYLIENNKTPADVEQMSADLERELMKISVTSEPTPDYPERPDFDEAKLEETLQKIVKYRENAARIKDVQSLASVHILRRGQPATDLRRAGAIFVTDNERLVLASRLYFKRANLEIGVPHCLTDVSITTQLWVRKPEQSPDVPRKFLIAESFAALNPDAETWERYLSAIERQARAGKIDDRQVKTLVYSNAARERFFELTHGLADAIDPDTPLEVIERHEAELVRPVEERAETAERELAVLRAKYEEQMGTVADMASTISTQATRLDEKENTIADFGEWKRRQEMREIRKRKRNKRLWDGGLLLLAVVALVAALVLPLAGVVSGTVAIAALLTTCGSIATLAGTNLLILQLGRVWHAVVVIAAVSLAAAFDAAWYAHKNVKWAGAAFLVVATLLGFIFAAYAFAESRFGREREQRQEAAEGGGSTFGDAG